MALGKIGLFLGLILLFADFSQAWIPRPRPHPRPKPHPRPIIHYSPFVGTRGSHFIVYGKPFLFNGFNSYWMMQVATQPSERSKVSQVFRDASTAGLTVCRTWAFADGGDYQALQKTPGVYDEAVFQGLDFVVSEAKKYGIYLILSLVNNWNDYGGKHQYVQWAQEAGEKLDNDDDFYTNPVIKQYYKNHVTKVLTRFNTITKLTYRDDPTIMAWELMNEPRCDADNSGKMVNGWIQEMARFVKSLDRKHMVENGMEGFYGEKNKEYNPGSYLYGTDFINNNLITEIDFTTIHAYPDAWLNDKSDSEQMTFMKKWLWSHWIDSTRIIRKPLVLSEFGLSRKNAGHDDVNVRNTYMVTIYRMIYDFARRSYATMGGSLVWQLMADGMDPWDDGYAIFLSQNSSTAGIMARHSWGMKTLSYHMF